jgi:hypothetical protein
MGQRSPSTLVFRSYHSFVLFILTIKETFFGLSRVSNGILMFFSSPDRKAAIFMLVEVA